MDATELHALRAELALRAQNVKSLLDGIASKADSQADNEVAPLRRPFHKLLALTTRRGRAQAVIWRRRKSQLRRALGALQRQVAACTRQQDSLGRGDGGQVRHVVMHTKACLGHWRRSLKSGRSVLARAAQGLKADVSFCRTFLLRWLAWSRASSAKGRLQQLQHVDNSDLMQLRRLRLTGHRRARASFLHWFLCAHDRRVRRVFLARWLAQSLLPFGLHSFVRRVRLRRSQREREQEAAAYGRQARSRAAVSRWHANLVSAAVARQARAETWRCAVRCDFRRRAAACLRHWNRRSLRLAKSPRALTPGASVVAAFYCRVSRLRRRAHLMHGLRTRNVLRSVLSALRSLTLTRARVDNATRDRRRRLLRRGVRVLLDRAGSAAQLTAVSHGCSKKAKLLALRRWAAWAATSRRIVRGMKWAVRRWKRVMMRRWRTRASQLRRRRLAAVLKTAPLASAGRLAAGITGGAPTMVHIPRQKRRGAPSALPSRQQCQLLCRHYLLRLRVRAAGAASSMLMHSEASSSLTRRRRRCGLVSWYDFVYRVARESRRLETGCRHEARRVMRQCLELWMAPLIERARVGQMVAEFRQGGLRLVQLRHSLSRFRDGLASSAKQRQYEEGHAAVRGAWSCQAALCAWRRRVARRRDEAASAARAREATEVRLLGLGVQAWMTYSWKRVRGRGRESDGRGLWARRAMGVAVQRLGEGRGLEQRRFEGKGAGYWRKHSLRGALQSWRFRLLVGACFASRSGQGQGAGHGRGREAVWVAAARQVARWRRLTTASRQSVVGRRAFAQRACRGALQCWAAWACQNTRQSRGADRARKLLLQSCWRRLTARRSHRARNRDLLWRMTRQARGVASASRKRRTWRVWQELWSEGRRRLGLILRKRARGVLRRALRTLINRTRASSAAALRQQLDAAAAHANAHASRLFFLHWRNDVAHTAEARRLLSRLNVHVYHHAVAVLAHWASAQRRVRESDTIAPAVSHSSHTHTHTHTHTHAHEPSRAQPDRSLQVPTRSQCLWHGQCSMLRRAIAGWQALVLRRREEHEAARMLSTKLLRRGVCVWAGRVFGAVEAVGTEEAEGGGGHGRAIPATVPLDVTSLSAALEGGEEKKERLEEEKGEGGEEEAKIGSKIAALLNPDDNYEQQQREQEHEQEQQPPPLTRTSQLLSLSRAAQHHDARRLKQALAQLRRHLRLGRCRRAADRSLLRRGVAAWSAAAMHARHVREALARVLKRRLADDCAAGFYQWLEGARLAGLVHEHVESKGWVYGARRALRALASAPASRRLAASIAASASAHFFAQCLPRAFSLLSMAGKRRRAKLLYKSRCLQHFSLRVREYVNRKRFHDAIVALAIRTGARAALKHWRQHARAFKTSRRNAARWGRPFLQQNRPVSVDVCLNAEIDAARRHRQLVWALCSLARSCQYRVDRRAWGVLAVRRHRLRRALRLLFVQGREGRERALCLQLASRAAARGVRRALRGALFCLQLVVCRAWSRRQRARETAARMREYGLTTGLGRLRRQSKVKEVGRLAQSRF